MSCPIKGCTDPHKNQWEHFNEDLQYFVTIFSIFKLSLFKLVGDGRPILA